ncbi:MAG: tetratricopeptide repeat-containing sensor histidine kinase [Bacteroidota bacterium]
MIKYKAIFLGLIGFSVGWPAAAQIDSLRALLPTATPEERPQVLNQLAWKLRAIDAEESRDFGLQAVEAATEQKDMLALINAYNFTGVAFRNMGYYEDAMDYYFLGLELALEEDNLKQQCYGYMNVANLNLYLGRPAEAFEYLKQLKPLAEELSDDNILGYFYLNYGRALSDLGQHAEALEHVQLSLDIRIRSNNYRGQYVNRKDLGNVYLAWGKYAQARQSYEVGLDLMDRNDDVDLYSQMTNGLAKSLLALGLYSQAIEYGEQSLLAADEVNSLSRAKEATETLAEIANAQQDYQAAEQYRQMEIDYSNRLFIKDLNLLTERYAYKLEATGLEHEKDKQALQFAAEKKRIFQLAVVSGISVVVLAFFGYRYLSQRRRNELQLQRLEMVEEQRNVLEMKVAERTQELAERNEDLKRLGQYKEDLTHMIAHDLKNPLNIILGVSEDPNIGGKAQPLKAAGQTMLQMVGNMLDVQKFEEAQMELVPTPLVLRGVVAKAATQVELLLRAKSLQLKNQVDPTLVVHADEDILLRVFMNLFTNAIKYSELGQTISIQAEECQDGRITVSVSDMGAGMSQEQAAHVFDKFYQAAARKSGRARSIGLGLTFCQLAVTAHGGEIGVRSALGEGSTFSFDLEKGQKVRPPQATAESPVEEAVLPRLLPEEWAVVAPIAEQLRGVSMYEAGKIRSLLSQLPDTPDRLAQWKQTVIRAARHWETNMYQTLLHPSPTGDTVE